MRQVLLAASLGLILLLNLNCSEEGDDDIDLTFTNPGDFTVKSTYPTSYNIGGDNCTSGGATHCAAIVFSTEIDDERYSGFAVRDTDEAIGSQNFFFKAWWLGSLVDGTYPMQVVYYNAGNYYTANTSCTVAFTPGTGVTTVTLSSCNPGVPVSGTVTGINDFY